MRTGPSSASCRCRRCCEASSRLRGTWSGPNTAPLGVIGADGLLEQFIHVGLDADAVTSIGDLPTGRGLLGALIDNPHPIRLGRIAADERSSGFPPGHPPMEGFLGVPIRSRNAVFGNLYLTNPGGGDFTAEDEDLVLGLAVTAGIAIENARLYEESRRRQLWLQASAEMAGALLSPGSRDALQLIAENVKRLADADTTAVVLSTADPEVLHVAVAVGANGAQVRGQDYASKGSIVAVAMDTGRGVRVDSIDDEPQSVYLDRALSADSTMAVPMCGQTGHQGAIVLGRQRGRRSFSANDMEMAEMFASYAGIARELIEARADQQKVALLEDRERIARDLHDHVVQRLFATGLSIQSVAALSTPALGKKLGRNIEDLDDTIRQIRTSIFQLTRTDAAEPGLRAAVLAVIGQVSPLLGFEPAIRFSGPIDTLARGAIVHEVEAIIREAVTNAAKHARSTEVVVQVTADADTLSVAVSDNGVGVEQPTRRSGLDNLKRRAAKLGGTLTITRREPQGTQILWAIPTPP